MNKWLHRHSGWAVATLLVIAALVMAGALQIAAAPLSQADPPFEAAPLPAEALSWSVDPLAGVRASGYPKLDSSLAGLAAASEVSAQATLAWADAQGLRLSAGRVHVQIVTDAAGLQGAIAAMTNAGGAVTKVGNNATLIQGWLPVDALEVVAANDHIFLIRRPAGLVLLENVEGGNSTTEGLAAINGPAWHTAGQQGAGVKIGVIDGGFLGYPGLLGVDLPAAVTVKNFVDGETDLQVDGTTKHGTACAEIVHDVAPAATLYLAKISTNLDLQEAVAWLKDTQQVDVISTSMGWYNLTPGDGTGEFADLVQSARAAGILWATAASNDREAHWGGLYYDPNNTGYHHYNASQNVNYFGPGNGDAYNIPAGYRVTVFLRWNDWSAVNQDYDLYLLRWNGSAWTIIARGENYQNGGAGQAPAEYVTAVTSGSATPYGFIIKRFDSNRAVNFEVFAPYPGLRLDELLHARSLGNLADAPGALTVAALDVVAPYPQEPYSSEGPTNGPGGAETGGFVKPNLAGFANVSTESYGVVDKFDGTSAAAPHVAGAAALVKGAYPAYSPSQVQSFLEGRAVDMGAAGKDTVYGHGRLYLGAPPATGPTSTPTPTGTTTATATPTRTPTATPTGDPGGVLKRYLPLLLRHGPAVTPTMTPSPTMTPTPTTSPEPPPGDWWLETVASEGNQGGWTSIALDTSGNPHISFNDITRRRIMYTHRTGVGWQTQDIDGLAVWVTDLTGPSAVAVGPNNYPQIAYKINTPGVFMRHAEWDGVTWNVVQFSGVRATWLAMALKQDGEPCISYYETDAYPSVNTYRFKLLCRTGGIWPANSTIISPPLFGTAEMEKSIHALAIDSGDRRHLSYTTGSLYIIREIANHTWELSLIDNGGSGRVGFYPSLALDSQDRAHISYYDVTNGDLKYARWDGSQWRVETVDSGGDVGKYTSIEVDGSGRAHISYYDSSNKNLKYARWDGSQWRIETVDSAGEVGEFTSLALDAAGAAHISYYDRTNGDLKYASNSGSFDR